MKTMRSALLLVAGVALPVLPATAADECCERPGITVVGEAEVRTVPDQAVLRLRVVTQDKDVIAAKTLNDEHAKATLALARRFGIRPEDLQTDAVAVQPQWTRPREGSKPSLIGYEVTKHVVLVLKDLARADELLTEMVKAGVNHVDAFELRTTEPRKYRDQARAMAIRAAREKASALAGEIGQSIGKAFQISEESEATGVNVMQNRVYAYDSNESEGSFAAGQNSVRARVRVSFELQ
jgi:uncharacterized protein YggE